MLGMVPLQGSDKHLGGAWMDLRERNYHHWDACSPAQTTRSRSASLISFGEDDHVRDVVDFQQVLEVLATLVSGSTT
jgi:hypothetical protein